LFCNAAALRGRLPPKKSFWIHLNEETGKKKGGGFKQPQVRQALQVNLGAAPRRLGPSPKELKWFKTVSVK